MRGGQMKRLVIVFVILVLIALAAAVAGVLLSDREGGSSLLGPTVLVWRVQGPVPEQTQPDVLGFASYATTSSVADLYRPYSVESDGTPSIGATYSETHRTTPVITRLVTGERCEIIGKYESVLEPYDHTWEEGLSCELAYDGTTPLPGEDDTVQLPDGSLDGADGDPTSSDPLDQLEL